MVGRQPNVLPSISMVGRRADPFREPIQTLQSLPRLDLVRVWIVSLGCLRAEPRGSWGEQRLLAGDASQGQLHQGLVSLNAFPGRPFNVYH